MYYLQGKNEQTRFFKQKEERQVQTTVFKVVKGCCMLTRSQSRNDMLKFLEGKAEINSMETRSLTEGC